MSILTFAGQTFYLSNFYNAPVLWGDEITPERLWDNNEIPFQLAKTVDPKERKRFIDEIEKTPPFKRAGVAKKAGGRYGYLTLRADWETNDGALKRQIMEDLVYDKFMRSDKLKNLLLATGDQDLVEGNRHGDRYWGQVDGVGRNELGKILVKVRAHIRCA